MPYLDKKQKFYDYGTKEFDGVNPFDSKRAESPFYRQFFSDPDYMEEYKNLKHSVVEMSPMQYFEECAYIFGSSTQKQIQQIKNDKEIFDHLKDVLFKYRRTFPITYLNYAEEAQEGRHRMYLVGELFGWNKKYPVMVVDWANPEKEKEKKAAQEQNKRDEIISNIDEIASNISNYEYDDVDEVIEDFKYYLNRNYSSTDIKISYSNYSLNFMVKGVDYKLPIWNFNVAGISQSDLDDYDEEDINAELERMGLKNW